MFQPHAHTHPLFERCPWVLPCVGLSFQVFVAQRWLPAGGWIASALIHWSGGLVDQKSPRICYTSKTAKDAQINFSAPSSPFTISYRITILLVITNGLTAGSWSDICHSNSWKCTLPDTQERIQATPLWPGNTIPTKSEWIITPSPIPVHLLPLLWALHRHLAHLHLAGPPAERESESTKALMWRRQAWEYEQKRDKIKAFFDDEALSYSTVLCFIDLV